MSNILKVPVSQAQQLTAMTETSPLPEGIWWQCDGATSTDDYWGVKGTGMRIDYAVEAGSLRDFKALTIDLLLEGPETITFLPQSL